MDRVVFLIDMDCFYVQVEQKMRPETIGLPCAVIQYTSLSSASLIAVSYEARKKGVSRYMNGETAMKQCPDLLLFQVPTRRGKADLTRYRDAGAEVINSLSKFTSKIERASIDEAYIDVTEMISLDSTNYVIASEKSNIVFDPSSIEVNAQDFTEKQPPYSFSINEIPCQMDIFDRISDGQKLKSALYLAQQIKRQILEDTSFRCSVGVAANRMLAKMACSLNKPDQITLVPLESMQHLMNFTRIRKVPGLGGKLGDDVSRRYNIECFGSLTEVPLSTLVADYGEKTG